MSKDLETFIAKGRRVGSSRESREIAFGLADLSTNPEVHERLVNKGGITTLVGLLTTAQDAEAQQFAALAIANTASTKTLCDDISRLEGVVPGLVQCVGNEQGDSIGRQYSALALGNLLAEPAARQTVVQSGAVPALIVMMKNCCDARELEAGKFAAFAISNVAFCHLYHQQIVEGGAIELLVALACCEDPDTQRQALAAVRGLCATAENKTKAVQKGILDPLILMSRSNDINIVREVSSALNSLSSEQENKEEISYRAISTLISLVMHGDTNVELHACCAIANLVESMDVHPRLLQEQGVAPLVALCSSPDIPCRIEASRAVANLSANPELIDGLIGSKALEPLVKSIDQDGDKCRFAALAIANFSGDPPSLFKIVQAGAIPHLVSLVSGPNNNLVGRRYGALALANLTACAAFHSTILNEGGAEALFSLSNSHNDLDSRRFVGNALANLSSNAANHERIVEMGGLQPIISLAYDNDWIVHKNAAAALRGFSSTGNNTKIVHEGGLEPLCRLLISEDNEVLLEATACICNLSLRDESKFEITKSGAVAPLIALIQSEDPSIAQFACESLANLAEMSDNQDFIAREGAVAPCISAMRSRHIEVQRESGRLLANLSACGNNLYIDVIIDAGGHDLLTSFLCSQDTYCQRVGAFGIGNLCTHDHHQRKLIGVLEPLQSLARSEKIELEIRRLSMLAIANLASCFGNHDDFVAQNAIPMIVSFSNSADAEMRNFAAFAVAELSRNSDMVQILTDEGGLEAVLYLARSDDKSVQRQVLPALTTLSSLDCNKIAICSNGALPPIIDFLRSEGRRSDDEYQLACCAIANLVETASNMPLVVNHGCIPLLVSALNFASESVQRESARALGNLAVNIDYSDLIINHGAAKCLVACFRSQNCECQRMAAMALSNLSSNLKSHGELLECGILGLVKTECLPSLDPKRFSDHETARFCVLCVTNLTGGKQSHSLVDDFFDILMDFTRHRDVKCRQHAILAIGNLCANPLHIKRLLEVKCTDALVSFSFPPVTDDSANAQFQAIAGLHGISKHVDLRVPLLREGGLEPLIIGARGSNRFSCVEIQREAAATLSNLALAEANRILIAKSGAMPALVNLVKKPDSICQVHAVNALANLAESTGEVHTLLLDELSLDPMCQLIHGESTSIDVKRAVSRFIALLASNSETHAHLLQMSVINSLKIFIGSTNDEYCERFGALTVANLALVRENHSILLKANSVESLLPLIHSRDIETLRGISFALHSFSIHQKNHPILESTGAVVALVTLARCGDRDTALQACLAVKHLSVCDNCRNVFVESHGLDPLLSLATGDDLDTKREVAATLRNISLSDQNKESIMNETGMLDVLAKLARDPDDEISHQACGVIANIAEREKNKIFMVEQGIVHHLQFSMLTKSSSVLRESLRAFANLSSSTENISCIVSSGALGHVIAALDSPDTLCRRFAAMAMSNLASSDESKARIVREHGLRPLISIARQTDRKHIDPQSQQHSIACLANLATSHDIHGDLLDSGCAEELSMNCLLSSNIDIRTNALLFISNFASNNETHSTLEKIPALVAELIKNLECNNRLVQLRAVNALRGLSTDPSYRERIISGGGVEPLLSFVHLDDKELKMEVLSTLCNLSLGGFMGTKADTLLQKVNMPSLLSFLCDSDSTHRIFGAMAIGNIASHLDLQAPVLDSGALQPLIGLSAENVNDGESQRCIAYAICNLSAEVHNRMSIIRKGGLSSIMYLCHTGDTLDMLAALSTIRGLAASDEARRPIVEEGVFSVLSLGTNTNCLQCKRAVGAILVLLSLNEENKFDLVRSDEMKEFVSLTDVDDVQCASQMCRCMGNISEVIELHESILQVFNVERLIHLYSRSDQSVALELSRLYANLAGNFNIHTSIVRPQILKKFGVLCLHTDADIRRFSVLALANLCLNVESHHGLEVEDLVSVLYNVIINDDFAKCHDKNDEKTFHKFVESKSFACLAISALCRNSSIVRRMTEVGIISAVLKLLQLDVVEMKLHVAFVLNKLSMFRSTHQELCRKQVASFLTNPNQESNGYALTYSIAALRRLCGDNIIRVELISFDVVNFMEKVCDLQNIERCREIASGIYHLALWDEARVHIMQSDMFDHILSLAQSSDVETSRFALGALANIAYDNRFHDVFAEKAGVVHTLVTLTKLPTLSVVRESSRALSNVFSSILAQTTFFRDGETDSLVNISKLEDYECAYNAAVAFRKLSANSLAHEYFLSCDWLGAVFDLSRREERNIQLQSAAALRDFSSNQDFKVAFAEMGGIHTAIELSSHPDIDLKAIAFGIIRHLSIPMQLKRKLVDCGIMSIMADCATLADNEDLLYQCASSIANMAEHAHNKVALVHMGVLRCLVALCKHESFQVVKRETARAFSLLSCAPENSVGVFDEKVLPHVIALLSCHEEETCRDSAATINNVATSPEIKKMIGDLGGIPHLVLLLASPHESCQINASRALSRLTTVNENKVSVFCSGGVKPLIQLCTSSNLEVSLMSIMVLCNLSTCSGYQIKFVEENGLPTVNQLLTSVFPLISKYATMILCNLTSHQLLRDHVSRQISLMNLVDLMNGINLECRAFATMTLCNLASKVNHGSAILDAGGLRPLLTMVNSKDGTNLQRAALLTLYNLSACETSHPLFVENNVTPSIVTIINGCPDLLCRRFALMILTNVACNDKTRAAAVKGGGLQAAILSLKDDDLSSRRFASIILANMSNDGGVRSQIVVHGGLQPLVTLCLADDVETQYCAFMCLSNLAANESNHSPLMKQGAFKAFVNASSSYIKRGGSPCSTFGIANLTSNGEILSEVGRDGGIMPLIYFAKSDNLHYQCLALSSLRRLAFIRENRDIMVANGIVETLTDACNTAEPVIQREVASCFCNLSLSSDHRLGIARLAMSEISYLTKSDDLDIVRLSLGALGNLAEDIETHAFMNNEPILDAIVACLEREGIDVRREAARAVTNMLTSSEIHPHIIRRGIDSLIRISAYDCKQCRYLTALSFRKLSGTAASHNTLVNYGLQNMMSLAKDQDIKIRKHASAALRDLCASRKEDALFFKLGVPSSMVELVRENDKEIQIIAVAALRHLASSDKITFDFSGSGIMPSVIRCISWANEDLRCQVAGLFANLSEHIECQSTMVSNGIVQAIDTLLSIEEHDEIWQDCSRTLANLCANEAKQSIIHIQGGLKILSILSKSSSKVCQRYVAIALRFMASSPEVQKSLSKGNHETHLPFVEFSASNLLDFQRAAAAAFASMSLNETGRSLVLRKGGIKSLLHLCIHLDLAIQRDAVFSIANFAYSPEFCQYVVIEGGVDTIKATASTSNNVEVLRDAARAMSSFSVDTATKEIMVSQEIPKVLCKLAKSSDSATQRFASLAICNLCSGTREQKELVVKQGVLRVLLFLLRFPDLDVERCASLAIAALSLGSDRNNAEIIDIGFVRPLIETISYPDLRMRQCALLALNGIALGELPETKERVFKDNGLPSLLDIIKTNDDECIHAGLYMLGTLGENVKIRGVLVNSDCLQTVLEKASVGSAIEIKRAAGYFLSLLAERPECHDGIRHVGGLEAAVAFASLVDEECQDYGAFTLAFLADNKSFQVPLVKMGGVRPLVAMMATNSDSQHYAAQALIKLADNFENHVTIAEEGGIAALLKLGRGKISIGNIQYKAALTVGQMAKNACSQLGSMS